MSKRFGRNQRRRAREQFAQLEYEHGLLLTKSSMQEGSLRNAAKEVQLLRQQIELAKIAIGRNYPAFPPERLALGFFPAPRDRFAVPIGPGDIATMAMMTISVDRDTVFNQVHFILTHGDKQSGYAISERAMQETPDEYQLCSFITEQLVSHLIEEYRKAGGRNGR